MLSDAVNVKYKHPEVLLVLESASLARFSLFSFLIFFQNCLGGIYKGRNSVGLGIRIMQATFSFHHLLAVEVGGSLKFFDHVFLDYTLKKA